MRLELTRSCDHYPLKVACIPISPPARRDSHASLSLQRVPRTGLEPAHLAACAPETHASTNSAIWACFCKAQKKRAENETRTRDPDLGKVVLYQLSYFRNLFIRIYERSLRPGNLRACVALHSISKSGCKSTAFFSHDQIFFKKNAKKMHFLAFKPLFEDKNAKKYTFICVSRKIVVPLHAFSPRAYTYTQADAFKTLLTTN